MLAFLTRKYIHPHTLIPIGYFTGNSGIGPCTSCLFVRVRLRVVERKLAKQDAINAEKLAKLDARNAEQDAKIVKQDAKIVKLTELVRVTVNEIVELRKTKGTSVGFTAPGNDETSSSGGG